MSARSPQLRSWSAGHTRAGSVPRRPSRPSPVSPPIPASSGLTNKHRLNRGGDRQLNRAMHTITLIRMRLDSATKTYVVRRVSEGKNSLDAQRCLIGEVSMLRPNPWAVTPR
ncbi:transposase [Streptomyces sp. NPDC002076]